MAKRFRSEVDSYLFHMVGDEESVAAFQEKTRTAEREGLESGEALDLTNLESAGDLGIADEFLNEGLGPVGEEGLAGAAPDEEATPSYAGGVPVILQVRRLDWNGGEIEGFRESSRVGDVVAGHASVSAIEQLSVDPDVIRIDVSRDAGEEELSVSLAAVGGDKVQAMPLNERGANALVGVIDGGLDVLHEAFRNAGGTTRIVALWDQRGLSGPAPLDDRGNPLYGTLYTTADIDGIIASGVVPHDLGRDRSGHGTHVTSIAAGRAAGRFTGGLAPEAGIVFVRSKLTTPHGDPNSIGYSMAHVDALAFMERVAREEQLPIAVNISQGMNAGAHDGTSTLEAAFDNFTSGGRMPGRVLVKSAGNAAADGLHAHFQIGQEQIVHLQWSSQQVSRRDDVIEVWYNSADDLSFVLEAPLHGGTTPALDRSSSPPRVHGAFASGNSYSMTLDRYHRDNGDARLSIRITRGSRNLIAPGLWTLRVQAASVPTAGMVDAWIERNNDKPLRFVTHVATDGTLSIPGTARTVISVAALDRFMQGQVMSFSSRGATRDGRRRPDVGAPGLNIEAARAGTRDDIVAMPGTSMAAPHVTGAIALLLSQQQASGGAQLNANQIRAALNQSSRGFSGHWNSARGWGMLDAEALLQLFR